jgi:signal transduction histidine kinase
MKHDNILRYFNNISSVLYAETNELGDIIELNNRFEEVIGKDKIKDNVKDIFINFNNEFHIKDFSDNQSYQLSITTASGIPETYIFWFLKFDGGYQIFGESNSEDIILLKKNLLEINSDLSNLSRELNKKNTELFKLNQEKNKLLGMVAHDLRNPIGAIKGYAELLLYLQQDNISYDISNILNIINRTSENTLKLLDELLDVSQIESGILTLKKEKNDFINFIEKILQVNIIIAHQKEITIGFISNIKQLEIDFDHLKMEQVLNNLISNAIKFSYSQTEITIRLTKQSDNILIEVEDQGQGVPKEEVNLLFKPLSKLSVRSTANEKSTGLGLSIAKSIVEGHGGEIGVKTDVGKGSIFYFTLPL